MIQRSRGIVLIMGAFLLILATLGTRPSNNIAPKVAQVRGAVVHIQKVGAWQGSGFVVAPDGLIVTAKHVVEGGGTFEVTFDDGRKVRTTQAIQHDLHDVGFLRVEGKNLQVAPMARTDLRPGEPVFVMGSPLGIEQFNSVTLGIVSAAQRDWSEDDNGLGWKVLIQSDAPGVYPGNSGGPVFNLRGEVIAVLVAGAGPGLHCSVPVRVFADKLAEIRLAFEMQRFEPPRPAPVPPADDEPFNKTGL